MTSEFKYNVGDFVSVKMSFSGGELRDLPGFTAKILNRRCHKGSAQYQLEHLRGWFDEPCIHGLVKEAGRKGKLRRVSFYAELTDAEAEAIKELLVHTLSFEMRIQNATRIEIQDV